MNNLTEEQLLKQQIKELVNKVSPFVNNTRTINAIVRFIIADRAKQKYE